MKKIKSVSIFIITFVLLLLHDAYFNKDDVATNHDSKARDGRIASVIDSGFDEYGLFSFEISDTDPNPTIFIVMDEAKNEKKLQEYLEKKVSKADLNHYNIEISKRNLQEMQTEHAMALFEGIAIDYINEKNYNDVQVHYSILKPKPVLRITINKISKQSSKDLKTELEDFLATKVTELPIPLRDISYEIQVVKI
ncbi:hypothetical protein [Cytobacillus oceanisediminis]|uniref:hypothetical protein n=1 Tax=Cytobacillus oceanisediminis TaxID=665099 RepID=UPI002079F8B9|nr:hypothetical protein [Cytobacillus oceanisediminis]USK45081.1 hypothetical protein LIT27_04215 [Cytobacillus oceanisediminis]